MFPKSLPFLSRNRQGTRNSRGCGPGDPRARRDVGRKWFSGEEIPFGGGKEGIPHYYNSACLKRKLRVEGERGKRPRSMAFLQLYMQERPIKIP